MKKTFNIALISISGIVSLFFFLGAIYDVLNYYFYFNPGKVAAEYETTMIFAGTYFIISLFSAFIFAISWRKFSKV